MIVRGRCHRGFNSPFFACTVHPRILSPIARLPALNLVTHVNQYRAAHGQHGTNPRESPAPNVIISSKTNKDHLLRTLQPLLLENGGKWQLGNDAKSLERMFKFKTFSKAWEFMDGVAKECTLQKHHPEWLNVYNKVFVRWTTHRPPGLSDKDLQMATHCSSLAAELGDVADSGETISFAAPKGD